MSFTQRPLQLFQSLESSILTSLANNVSYWDAAMISSHGKCLADCIQEVMIPSKQTHSKRIADRGLKWRPSDCERWFVLGCRKGPKSLTNLAI
jgi:hypothetical protein